MTTTSIMENISVSPLAYKIWQYWNLYPEAKDTLYGIATWWLNIECSNNLEKALAELLEMKIIKKRKIGNQIIYFRNLEVSIS